jgi:hypothetical protein
MLQDHGFAPALSRGNGEPPRRRPCRSPVAGAGDGRPPPLRRAGTERESRVPPNAPPRARRAGFRYPSIAGPKERVGRRSAFISP